MHACMCGDIELDAWASPSYYVLWIMVSHPMAAQSAQVLVPPSPREELPSSEDLTTAVVPTGIGGDYKKLRNILIGTVI
jgi:hypothetical protein